MSTSSSAGRDVELVAMLVDAVECGMLLQAGWMYGVGNSRLVGGVNAKGPFLFVVRDNPLRTY
jgi:hypothetical protein